MSLYLWLNQETPRYRPRTLLKMRGMHGTMPRYRCHHPPGVRAISYEGAESEFEIDQSSSSIVRDPNKCIRCRRCETMCNDVQTVGVYSAVGRGFKTVVKTAWR